MSGHSWTPERTRAIAAAHQGERGSLLPVLHDLVAEFGYVDPRAIPVIAEVLRLSRAEVHGVISFYEDFPTTPSGRVRISLCRAEACQAVGADALAAHAVAGLGIEPGQTTSDGSVTLADVYCLGDCALGPAMLVGDRLHGCVDPDRFDTVLAESTAGVPEPARDPDPCADPDAGLGVAGITVYVPGDAAARSVGSDEVAAAIHREASARSIPVTIVRTGSRGLLWLEPLIEVDTPDGRLGHGPVTPADVPGLFDHGFTVAGFGATDGEPHWLALGLVERLPWLARQDRLAFARVGVVDPRSIADYRARGGLAGLERALSLPPEQVIDEVTRSGLRGRGGAGFPAGVKWRTVAGAPGPDKFICANADEGDSGTFADRMLFEGDPFAVIEGMLIAAHAVGAREGYLYLRSEYPDAAVAMTAAIEAAYAANLLGDRILGSPLRFDLHLRRGAGAYICGEETAMLESLEGRRGQVRAKPPLPALTGLFGAPTVINNVLTLASVPWIMANGAAAYAARGVGRSVGTQVFQLGGDVRHGGIVEVPFGITLGELVNDYGGGTRSGRPVRAVQVGGPLGAYLPVDMFDLPMDYEALAEAGAMLGHGGVVVFDDTVDLARQARFAMAFCAAQSCGTCTPCRVGAVRGVETIDKIIAGERREANLALLDDLCEVMTDGSLCALGGLTPVPVRSALRHFGADFEPPTRVLPARSDPPRQAAARSTALPSVASTPTTKD